jgi:hypothetical protein
MMPVYFGVVKGKVILLPENLDLPEGIRVEIRTLPEETSSEDVFKERLITSGLVRQAHSARPPRRTARRKPAHVKGSLLSEVIIEERR